MPENIEVIAGVTVRQVCGTLLVNGRRVDVHADRADSSITITDSIDRASFIAGLRAALALTRGEAADA